MKYVLYMILMSFSLSVNAATWQAKQGTQGADAKWIVLNGKENDPNTVKIESKNKRTANRLKKKLNDIEAEDNVWNDGSEHCDNPLNEC